jgi:hypothetical protein
MSAAVFFDADTHDWEQLANPITRAQTDFAFVITPEPAMFLLLGLAYVFLGRKKA